MQRLLHTLLVLMWVIHAGVEAVFPMHHLGLCQTQIQIISELETIEPLGTIQLPCSPHPTIPLLFTSPT